MRTADLPATATNVPVSKDPISAGDHVDLSLSVVLPVHNAESRLAQQVAELLELLPDITPRFEILIVDDGSTDQTEEVAHELARQYPQLTVRRHATRQGEAAAVRTGMDGTCGDVVFVHDEDTVISTSEIRRLWDMRHDEQLVMARAEMPRRTLSPHLMNRLTLWGDQLRDSAQSSGLGGIQMIRRDAVEQLDALVDAPGPDASPRPPFSLDLPASQPATP